MVSQYFLGSLLKSYMFPFDVSENHDPQRRSSVTAAKYIYTPCSTAPCLRTTLPVPLGYHMDFIPAQRVPMNRAANHLAHCLYTTTPSLLGRPQVYSIHLGNHTWRPLSPLYLRTYQVLTTSRAYTSSLYRPTQALSLIASLSH